MGSIEGHSLLKHSIQGYGRAGHTYLAECGLIVQPGASVAMSTGPNFEVERAVYPIVGVYRNKSVRALRSMRTYLSFSVPKIDAKYSAIFT